MRVVSSLILMGFCSVSFAQYEAIYLHPAGYNQSYGYGASNGTQGGAAWDASSNNPRAALWTGSAASFVNLHPFADGYSYSFAVSNNVQVGTATGSGLGWVEHASLWTGTAASWVDLHPAGFNSSILLGVRGNQQVGGAYTSDSVHAGLWSGTAASFVDLHVAGFVASFALATDGAQQGGFVQSGGSGKAAMWSGTAASYVDLHPGSDWGGTSVSGVASGQQVGSGYVGIGDSRHHALLWTGSAASMIDLHPAGMGPSSNAIATDGVHQVGWASDSATGLSRAFRWSGSAASALDLHAFLSADYKTSVANGIDPITGDIFGYAFNVNTGTHEAVLWRVESVPEPATMAALALGIAACLRRRKR